MSRLRLTLIKSRLFDTYPAELKRQRCKCLKFDLNMFISYNVKMSVDYNL